MIDCYIVWTMRNKQYYNPRSFPEFAFNYFVVQLTQNAAIRIVFYLSTKLLRNSHFTSFNLLICTIFQKTQQIENLFQLTVDCKSFSKTEKKKIRVRCVIFHVWAIHKRVSCEIWTFTVDCGFINKHDKQCDVVKKNCCTAITTI